MTRLRLPMIVAAACLAVAANSAWSQAVQQETPSMQSVPPDQVAPSVSQDQSAVMPAIANVATINVVSPAFGNGQPIPKKYTKDGQNVSPPLSWSGVPDKTQEIVVMVEDPDGSGGNFSHWILWGLSPKTRSLPEGLPPQPEPSQVKGAMQGKNSFVETGYDGPLPWPGTGTHRYMFRVFALDKKIEVKPNSTKEDLQKAMYGHVIGQGLLIGTYERPMKPE